MKIRQEMSGTSSKEAHLHRKMKLREIAITKYHRDKSKAEIEANYRRGELELRQKRRLNNPKWHTERRTYKGTRAKESTGKIRGVDSGGLLPNERI